VILLLARDFSGVGSHVNLQPRSTLPIKVIRLCANNFILQNIKQLVTSKLRWQRRGRQKDEVSIGKPSIKLLARVAASRARLTFVLQSLTRTNVARLTAQPLSSKMMKSTCHPTRKSPFEIAKRMPSTTLRYPFGLKRPSPRLPWSTLCQRRRNSWHCSFTFSATSA